MPRYKLIVEYDGTPFAGWQRQTNAPSVQGTLEEAIFAFSGERVSIIAAGRTDTGVHARGQCVHFDLAKEFPSGTVRDALNAHLRPAPISVLFADDAAREFHARFDAIKRHYLYRIIWRKGPLSLDRNRAWWVPYELDIAAMRRAAESLVGTHDFTTFRAAQCQANSPVKTLDDVRIDLAGEELTLQFSARSFLHSQVRSMTGSLIHVARGKWAPDEMRSALEACDRTRCGPLAPPDGLYLMRADYPGGEAK